MKFLHTLCLSCFTLLLCSCVGRATSTLDYYPPENTAQSDSTTAILVQGKPEAIKAGIVNNMRMLGFNLRTKEDDASSLVFFGQFPDLLQKNALDCGRLSIYSPQTMKSPQIFPTVSSQEFSMADGTTFPKPAILKPTANATVFINLSAEGKTQTRIELRVEYHVKLTLHRWIMTSGFSYLSPAQISKRATEETHITFNSGETGRSQTPLPEFRHQLSGDWPVQCIATGVFERWLLDALQKANK